MRETVPQDRGEVVANLPRRGGRSPSASHYARSSAGNWRLPPLRQWPPAPAARGRRARPPGPLPQLPFGRGAARCLRDGPLGRPGDRGGRGGGYDGEPSPWLHVTAVKPR